jgi:hypothetical protein
MNATLVLPGCAKQWILDHIVFVAVKLLEAPDPGWILFTLEPGRLGCLIARAKALLLRDSRPAVDLSRPSSKHHQRLAGARLMQLDGLIPELHVCPHFDAMIMSAMAA